MRAKGKGAAHAVARHRLTQVLSSLAGSTGYYSRSVRDQSTIRWMVRAPPLSSFFEVLNVRAAPP